MDVELSRREKTLEKAGFCSCFCWRLWIQNSHRNRVGNVLWDQQGSCRNDGMKLFPRNKRFPWQIILKNGLFHP